MSGRAKSLTLEFPDNQPLASLPRPGEDSHMVVTELPGGRAEGLNQALAFLEGVEGVGVTRFGEKDVVRHPLVARIVAAYTRADKSSGKS